MRKQREIVAELTDRQLVLNVYLSQFIMLLLAIILSFFVFDHWIDFLELFQGNLLTVVFLSGAIATVIVMVDLLMERVFPKEWLDDGGINERVFRGLTIPKLFLLCAVVAIAEELLFRAVIQSTFGLIIASSVFALIHIRYLDKPVLFINVCLASFLLGGLFYWTGSITVTIFTHFLIDVILGLIIRNRYLKQVKRSVVK
ncbi:CPBP family intramembrane glutamic endopeptidase [Halalkalibacter krulwichiae]|uniref:CAAX amino terminal protease self-immunity n=1 Tax=Halalkalibacter krulwichiae TaxID=199441 RepID=A0A1X9MA31_9BACI|nr:CPBP family intramembrane glutamic endopeptidase [Halalkalibacter krulwichiae]ARK30268.1 CAAX amino terminal protease self- immunity [Halalkalibacter krulwichiae]